MNFTAQKNTNEGKSKNTRSTHKRVSLLRFSQNIVALSCQTGHDLPGNAATFVFQTSDNKLGADKRMQLELPNVYSRQPTCRDDAACPFQAFD